MDFVKAAFDAGGQAVSFASASSSHSATCMQDAEIQPAVRPLPPAATKNASPQHSAGSPETCAVPSSLLFPGGSALSSSPVPSPEAAESFSSNTTGGTSNPFAFHSRSRLLTPRALLSHPPAFPSSFSAAAEGTNGDTKQTYDTSQRRVASFFRNEDKHTSSSSSRTPFNKGRCDNAGYSSLRLLLPPQPGGCSLSAGAPGQGHNPFDSSNSCMTASSCCTTDASSHSGTLLGSSSPILSFSMPATPRLPQFYSPGSHQPAAYAGLPPGSLSPIDATSYDAPCTTNTVLAADWKDTKARLISSHLPSAVVSESSAAAAARAWPAKRRRSIQVDGSSNQSYMLPTEQLQQQVSYLNGRGTGEQQHPSALQQEQQQQNTGCTSRLDPAIEEETHHYISSNRVNSTNTPMTGTAAQQQQQQQKTQGTPGYPPVMMMMMMTALSDDSKGYPMRPRSFSALAGGCSNIPHVIVSQPERLSGREKTGNPTREDINIENNGNNDNGTVNASWYSAEEVLKAQEDNADAGVRAVSDADATGGDNGNCSWASQTATGFLNDACRRSPVATCAAQGESADAEGATGGGQQRRWEFLDSGCYSVGYHTAMAVVPYSALSTESKAAQQLLEQQQALLLDREREARRRRKACLSVLRSVHNALSASPPRDKHTAVAARRSSSPGGVLPADTSSHSFLPFTYSLSTSRKNSLHGDEVAFTDGAAEASAQLRGGDTATATAHKQPLQGKEGGTGLCFFAADTSTSSASSSQDSSFPASKGGVVTYNIPVPRSTTAFGSSVQQRQMSTQQQQQQFFLSVLPHCQRDQQQQSATMTAADLDASGNSTAARSAASNRHASAGFSLGATAGGTSEDESRARSNPCTSVPTCEKQAGAESVSLSSSGLLRLQPEWLSPYTLAALIGACVHCYDVIRAAYPAPEPPPRLCLISLPALYTQLPPHLLEGAVLLDESALNLGSPPQCLPIECSSISHPSGQNVAGGAGRRSSNNSSNGSDKGSWTNNGLSRGEEIGTRTLPGNLLGQFDIIVCETRSVTLATVENVAACVKALSRRRRRTRYSASGKKAARRYGGAYTQQVEGSIPSRLGGQGESPSMGRKEVHMQSTTSDNEDDEKEEEDKDSRLEKEEEEEIEEEEEEVDVAAAALGCLSLLKVGQSDGGATTPEKQLKEQQLQQQLQQQQETFQRLPSSVRVIMLSTCLLSAVIDDLLGLKQCRFQPYVPSSALSSLQLQCIYTNFEDYPLFQKHNDFDFTTRVRARRGGARFAKGPRRGGAIESMESCAGGHIHSRAGSSSRRETQAREPGGGDDTVLRDPLISRALALQAEQEARAAAHPGEIPGEATLAHSTTNDEFSSEKSAAEEEADDASDLLVGGQQEAVEGEPCQSCQRHRETTLMNAFEAFHLQASPTTAARTMSQQQELPLQSACVVPPPSHEIADKTTTTYAYSDPASCCQHNRRLSLGENCQRRGGETNSSLGQSQEITHSKAYHGITMRQGDDDEDDGIDYDLECGSHFGMVAHDL